VQYRQLAYSSYVIIYQLHFVINMFLEFASECELVKFRLTYSHVDNLAYNTV